MSNKVYHCSYSETWRYGGYEEHDYIVVAESEERALELAKQQVREDEAPQDNCWGAEEITTEHEYIEHISSSTS